MLSASSRSVQLPSPDLSSSPSVYLVDDEPGVLTALPRLLRSHVWATQTYGSAEAFLAALPASAIGCAVMDLAMPEMQAMLAGRYAVGASPMAWAPRNAVGPTSNRPHTAQALRSEPVQHDFSKHVALDDRSSPCVAADGCAMTGTRRGRWPCNG
jgi:hypothetical protein